MEDELNKKKKNSNDNKVVLPPKIKRSYEFGKMFNRFFEKVPDAFISLDDYWKITNVNIQAEQILQQNKNDLIGKSIWDYFSEADDSDIYKSLYQAKSEGKQVQLDSYYKPSGSWFSIRVFPSTMGLLMNLHDITWHKQAEEALHACQERFECIFEFAPIGMATVSLEGQFSRVNSSLCNILGYSKQDLLSMKLKDLTYPDDISVEANYMGKLLQNEITTYQIEKRSLHKSGSIVNILSTATLVRNNQGAPLYFIIQTEDISERKQTEEALRKNEAKFKSYINQSVDGVHVIDEKGHYIEVNPAGCQMLGYSQEEMLEMSIDDIIAPGQTDGFDHFSELMNTGESKGEITALRKDGTQITVEIHAVALGNNRFMGVVRDITDRKRAEQMLQASEERFRGAFHYAPIGMAMVTLEGNFIKVNESLCEIWGYSEEELLKMKFQEITHQEDLEEAIDNRQQLIRGEINNYWTEKRYIHKSGRLVHCLLSATLVRDDTGNPDCFVSQIQDITERKLAVQALAEREAMYRTLFEKSKNPILVIDKNGFYIDCNEEALKFLECDRNELLSRSVTDTLPPGKELIMQHHKVIWKNGGTIETEYWVNGKIKVMDLTITNVLWQGKQALIGIGRDITKQKEDELALRESEERYRRLVEFFPNTISVVSDEKIVFINRAGSKLFGVDDASELFGRPILDFVHPSCKEAVKNKLDSTEEGIVTTMMEGKFQRLNGESVDVDLSTIPFTYKGKPAVQVIIRDITKRKQTEGALATEKERLAVTLKSIHEGVITADSKGHIVLMNKSAETLTGWQQDEAIGKPLESIVKVVNEKTGERCEDSGTFVLNKGEKVTFGEQKVLLSKDGLETLIIDSATPIITNEGKVVGVVLVLRDITDQRKMEEEFLKVEKLESLGILAGGIAHDFNNILTVVLGNIALAQMVTPEDTETYEQLEEIEEATLQAKDLTKQLLTFAKGGAPILKTTSIKQLIKDTVGFVLRGSNVKCKYDLPKDLWPVEIDEGQISQVLNNLIINAKQAMPNGGVIRVTAENLKVGSGDFMSLPDGKYIKVSVEDQGTGIPEENLQRIFDPYFTTKPKGSGLGLATAYSVIRKHNGYITVESEEGIGTSFYIVLPASQNKIVSKRDDEQFPTQGKGKVLIMDDEPTILYVAGTMLKRFGYDVSDAQDGEEAIELYKRAMKKGNTYDVVIMDLTVPGAMGGKETISKLLEIDPKVKAIVSSGYSNDPIMADYKNYGFVGVVAKPYKVADLSKVVYQVINAK